MNLQADCIVKYICPTSRETIKRATVPWVDHAPLPDTFSDRTKPLRSTRRRAVISKGTLTFQICDDLGTGPELIKSI